MADPIVCQIRFENIVPKLLNKFISLVRWPKTPMSRKELSSQSHWKIVATASDGFLGVSQ